MLFNYGSAFIKRNGVLPIDFSIVGKCGFRWVYLQIAATYHLRLGQAAGQ